MKLAFSTLGCPDWTFEKVVTEGQRMGYTGIEIRGIDGEMRAEKIPQFFPENAEKTKKMLRDKGLTVVGFGTSVNFHDDEHYDESLKEGRQAIDVCALMGIPAIRVFGDRIIGDETEAIKKVAKGLRMLCEYAKDKHVIVMLEIHGDFNRLEVVMPVIERVKDCPAFAILWDIAHSDRTYGDNWRAFYDGIKPWVRHLHIKDHLRNNDSYDLCLPGEGEVPIGDICTVLQADGYKGWYSFEWEKKWHPSLPEPEIAFPCYVKCMKTL